MTLLLFTIACAVMVLLCLPGAIAIVEWLDAQHPGLKENLKFWAIVCTSAAAVLVVVMGANA